MSAPPAESAALRRRLAAAVSESWTPGAAWWVEGPRGVVDHGAVGHAAREPELEPARETTPYDLASLTKPLCTALLAALLEQESVLDLEAPAAGQLGELAGTLHAERTLLDLGAHRAGFPPWQPLYLRARSSADYVREIARVPPTADATPYSDLGYILLGIALERAGGRTLDRLFDERVARPLGLRSTGFAVPPGRFANAAPTERGNLYERALAGEAGGSHEWRTHLLRGEVHDGNAHALGGVAGHAGLFGTVEEVARLAREILRPASLGLGERARARLLERVPGSRSRTFGMVLAAESEAARGVLAADAPGHTGFTGTSLWFEPDRDAFYVLLSNRVHPQVQTRGVQPVRRDFHRIAAALV